MQRKLKRPILSILDPRFRYTDSANTDVGRHLRAHERAQRKAAAVVPSSPVLQLRKKAGGRS